ncbi:MAG: hypothetical protein COY81_05215 [Candidatus Pacebacteria bacterium CG_4_10_14_0_8_um_filter_43_12]|nr:MAG: hypothetical protein COY81_05215 [Candidatus Pacebacteria bacterium CG_4_10_14_0_8_um_filter_43_12]
MLLNTFKTTGFTLIEMLVAITILLLVTGGSMAAFSTFNDRRQVEETAKQAQQYFTLAQQKASVKETPQDCITDNRSLQGYRVALASNSVTLQALCGSNLTDLNPYNLDTFRQFVFPNGVTTTAGDYDFYTLERGTSGSGTYTFSGSSTMYQFTVTAGGTVSNVQPTPAP